VSDPAAPILGCTVDAERASVRLSGNGNGTGRIEIEGEPN
jgi:hypothetical protein